LDYGNPVSLVIWDWEEGGDLICCWFVNNLVGVCLCFCVCFIVRLECLFAEKMWKRLGRSLIVGLSLLCLQEFAFGRGREREMFWLELN
jgi:hypothetical protein